MEETPEIISVFEQTKTRRYEEQFQFVETLWH